MRQRGNIIISVLLTMVFTLMGLGLLMFTDLHIRIRQALMRKNKECELMRQELLREIHDFREKVFAESAGIGGYANGLKDFFNQEHFPVRMGEFQKDIRLSHVFRFRVFNAPEGTRTQVIDSITASWTKSPYVQNSETVVDAISGKIPLTEFSFFQSDFLVSEPGDPPLMSSVEEYLRDNRLEVSGGCPPVTGRRNIGMDSSAFIMNCLEISGTVLTWPAIRKKFGLPAGDTPPPQGIHLLVENNVLKCMFIQGDVDRMIFSAVGSGADEQRIEITMNGQNHVFSYRPGVAGFQDREKQEPWLFKQRVAVNGSVWWMEQLGDAAFTGKTELLVYSPGRIRIGTGLTGAGKNLALRKMKPSTLTLVCSSQALMSRENSPGVEVDADNGSVIDAAFLCAGTFWNGCNLLRIRGSLFCYKLDNLGELRIEGLPSCHPLSNPNFHTAPELYITGFMLNSLDEE